MRRIGRMGELQSDKGRRRNEFGHFADAESGKAPRCDLVFRNYRPAAVASSRWQSDGGRAECQGSHKRVPWSRKAPSQLAGLWEVDGGRAFGGRAGGWWWWGGWGRSAFWRRRVRRNHAIGN